jgi:osmotically-inducible protein OsmY
MFLCTEVIFHESRLSTQSVDLCEIAVAARQCLYDSPYRTMRRVSCECQDSILFLRGNLSSFYEKQVAQETVAGIKGTTQVVNEIEVD